MVEVSSPSFHTYADVVVIKNLLFKNVDRQQDAHELLINLLTTMREADPKHLAEQTPSFIQEIFEGAYRQQLVCANAECGSTSHSIQPFMDLPLELDAADLIKCLVAFFSEETLSENDQYRCDQYCP